VYLGDCRAAQALGFSDSPHDAGSAEQQRRDLQVWVTAEAGCAVLASL
jgi:hypothetical protein